MIITEPLQKLTRKHEPWVWSNEPYAAFEKLKDNPKKSETQVIYDGSPFGLGGILSPKQANGEMRQVGYTSKTLTPVERQKQNARLLHSLWL